MGEKKPTLPNLTEGAESARSADIREPFGQLPVPSLEERARLLLRAIHGERDFTSSEHAEAHSTILNAMSADIAAKSNSGMPVEMKPLGATTVESGYGAAPTVAMSPLVEDRPIYASARRISSAFEDRQESQRNPAPQEYAARIARTSLEARPSPAAPRASASMATTRRVPGARLGDSLPPFPAPTHKPAKRRVFIWGAALSIFAAVRSWRSRTLSDDYSTGARNSATHPRRLA
jgi:hypothetical protein